MYSLIKGYRVKEWSVSVLFILVIGEILRVRGLGVRELYFG